MNLKRIFLCGIFCSAMLIASPPVHADISGQASVIDGDTIEIHGQRIRFFGIDAPESSQTCKLSDKEYRCGQKAAFALDELISKKTVHCKEKDKDKYGRINGECFTGATNLNAWMVSHGWALAYRQYSQAFVTEEEVAKTKNAGIWAGTFQNPWDFRHSPTEKETILHGECLIKGNISSKGKRIYHVQGTSLYGKTKIDTSKGERWFCSEEQAREAGWRKAKPR